MTIPQLIAHLQQLLDHGTDADSVVECWDVELQRMAPVTTIVYGLGRVELTAEGDDENADS